VERCSSQRDLHGVVMRYTSRMDEFDDFEGDTEDSVELDLYAEELKAAVQAFGLTPKESGELDGDQ
jgi:hypothetical protein